VNNCSIHKRREAKGYCYKCHNPICDECYNVFKTPNEPPYNGVHLCAECFKKECEFEYNHNIKIQKMVKKEMKFIIVGMIIGLIISLYLIVKSLIDKTFDWSNLWTVLLIPFIIGSLLTIVKRVIRIFVASKPDASNSSNDGDISQSLISLIIRIVLTMFIAIIILILSPIITIRRIILRRKDLKSLDEMIYDTMSLCNSIDEYMNQLSTPSLTEQSTNNNDGSVEVSIDAILGNDIKIGQNGQLLHKIQYR